MYSDITGIILSGGKSSRMGVNKSLLKIGDITVIELIAGLMKSVFENVIIISNIQDDYAFLKFPVFEDIYKGKGPLAGIHSGLKNSCTEKNFIVSCDIPLLTKEIIEFIVNYDTDKLITICTANGFLQPFAGLYNKSLLNEIEVRLGGNSGFINHSNETERKQCDVMSFIKSADAEILNPEKENGFDENTFMNINTQEDFRKLEKISGCTGKNG